MLSLIVFFPLLAAFALFVLRPGALRLVRGCALGVATIELVMLALAYRSLSEEALVFRFDLAPSLGWIWQFQGDGAGLAFAALAALTTLVVVAHPFAKNQRKASFLALATLSLALGAIFATDLTTFFLFHELMALPIAVLLVGWGGTFGFHSAKRFLATTLFSSSMLLAATAYLHFREAGALPVNAVPDGKEPWLLVVAFCLGFGTRLAVFPLHSWFARVQTELPKGSVPLLNSLMIPVSFLGFLRHAWPHLANIRSEIEGPLLFIAAFSALFAAFYALGQKRPGRQLSLLVMASVSLAFCSLLSGSPEGANAAVILLLAQSLGYLTLSMVWGQSPASLPLLGEGTSAKQHSRAQSFLRWVVVMAALGFPGSLVFVAEFLFVYTLIDSNPVVALTSVVTFLVIAWGLIQVVRNPAASRHAGAAVSAPGSVALDGIERTVLVVVLVLNLAAGLAPYWLLSQIETALAVWLPPMKNGMGG